MGRKPRKFEPDFKMKLVLSVLRGEASQEELARRHSVSPGLLAKWKEKFIEAGLSGFAREGRSLEPMSRLHQLESEIASRDQVIGELTLANRLLKKNLRII